MKAGFPYQSYSDQIVYLVAWCPTINKWIDDTQISSSQENLVAIQDLKAMFETIAIWTKIQLPYGDTLATIVRTYKRLVGFK